MLGGGTLGILSGGDGHGWEAAPAAPPLAGGVAREPGEGAAPLRQRALLRRSLRVFRRDAGAEGSSGRLLSRTTRWKMGSHYAWEKPFPGVVAPGEVPDIEEDGESASDTEEDE